jgi:CRP/FNR family transcriptional regulator, cyclic AMP receptor protein
MDINLKKKLGVFFSGHSLVKYKKGEIILRPGEKPGYVGFIKSGFVRVYTLSENGQEITMQFFKPILYFTAIYAVTGVENRFYFEAITPIEMYEAPVGEVEKFFAGDPEAKNEVVNNILSSFIDLAEQMGTLLSGNAYNKVATMVSSLVKRTEGEDKNYEKVNFGITHKLIASLTGLTRETVTLQMLRLEREGAIINKNKKVMVVDKGKLAKAARAEK